MCFERLSGSKVTREGELMFFIVLFCVVLFCVCVVIQGVRFVRIVRLFILRRNGGIGRRTKSTGTLPSRKGYSNQKVRPGSNPGSSTLNQL